MLELSATKAQGGMDRLIKGSHVQRPGLSLAGYAMGKKGNRILIFGKMELAYLKELSPKVRLQRLEGVVTDGNPLVIVSRGLTPPKELVKQCQKVGVPLFRSPLKSMNLISKLTVILAETFAPSISVHGTLVEAYGIGVLIQGDSSVGKSEAALGLIERGHRLISDDVVLLRGKEEQGLIGSGPELNKHLLELRGIGIVNVAHLFGAVSVRKEVPVDLVIHLEDWDETHYYDRVGLEERFTEFLGTRVPLYLHPVKPGRDIVLLIETTILNHRLKMMGYHSAKEFNQKLLEEIARKKEVGREG
ncbi:MAG: HPr(Ser) kinase/phosphatase [Chlamydiia bacterium]|nr:HPr(Ser) kinase/phosphatase [Chlamydiia bacterium]